MQLVVILANQSLHNCFIKYLIHKDESKSHHDDVLQHSRYISSHNTQTHINNIDNIIVDGRRSFGFLELFYCSIERDWWNAPDISYIYHDFVFICIAINV